MNDAIHVTHVVRGRKLILLDILSYIAAPLVLLVIDILHLPNKLIDIATKAHPEDSHPYTLVSGYGYLFAGIAVLVTAVILSIRLVISRKRWYLLIPLLGSTFWFVNFIRHRFLFG